MDGDEDWTPFWVQERDNRRRSDRVRHGVLSMFFSSGILVMLLVVTALFFLVFVVPSAISFTTQVFKPINVRKSWDSINVVLVLFALVFGFLSRSKNQENYNSPKNSYARFDEMRKSNPTTPHQWYGYSPREGRMSNPSTPHEWHGYSDSGNVFGGGGGGGGGGLRRTYSSYPDLRGWSNELAYDDPWRFNDDTVVETYRRSESGRLLPLPRRSFKEIETNPAEIKNVVHQEPIVNLPTKEPSPDPPRPMPPPEQPTLPPSPPPQPKQEAEPPHEQPKSYHKPRRTSQSGGQKLERRKRRDNVVEETKPIEEPRTPPPPPPPPLPPPSYYTEQRSSKMDKKRGGASATKEFLNSLYHKKKKKKQISKSIDNLDSLLNQSTPPATHFHLPPPSPPPPPPPLPPPFFHLFSSKKDKKRKTEKPSPVPKPPPVPAKRRPIPAARESHAPHEAGPSTIYKNRFEGVNEKPLRGGAPVMHIPLPPPPPPPPPQYYKPAWKFVVQGDYVRMDSFSSSEPSDVDSDVTPTAAAGDGGSPLFPPSPLFCPSPDVDTKAERFISRFRAGLKLEKINSMKKQDELGLSNLGPNKGSK